MSKPWWASKTIWVNLVSMLVTYIAKAAGWDISAQDVATLIAAVNIILRAVSHGKITLTNAGSST